MESVRVSCQSSQVWASQQIQSKVRAFNAQRYKDKTRVAYDLQVSVSTLNVYVCDRNQITTERVWLSKKKSLLWKDIAKLHLNKSQKFCYANTRAR